MNTPTTTTATQGALTIKVAHGDDLRRFELRDPSASSLLHQVTCLWPHLPAPTLRYKDADGDHITLGTQADLDELLQHTGDTSVLRLTATAPSTPLQHSKRHKLERVASALGVTTAEAGVLMQKARDGDTEAKDNLMEAKNSLMKDRTARVAEALTISEVEAACLVEAAHAGDQEARGKLKQVRQSQHSLNKGRHNNKSRKIAAVANIAIEEAEQLVQKAHRGDEQARKMLQRLRHSKQGGRTSLRPISQSMRHGHRLQSMRKMAAAAIRRVFKRTAGM